MAVHGLIIALALAGLANALYFTLAYYGRVRKSRWVPEVLCAREGSSCVTVVQTPYARVFGLPNSLLGIAYYMLVMGWLLAGPAIAPAWLPRALVAASAGTVAFGFYLIHALRSKLHVNCPLCYAAHAINLGIFMLLLV
ncbi:MAG: hypothetical protein HYS33_07735 [Acidobacteria bacterium]|nr:hypothetical protein [Acidobacteriota bacterium]